MEAETSAAASLVADGGGDSSSEVDSLREKYINVFGKSARGPHASNVAWLQKKLAERKEKEKTHDGTQEEEQEQDEESEVEKLREQYIDVFGRSARGPSAHNVDWLRNKIAGDQDKVKNGKVEEEQDEEQEAVEEPASEIDKLRTQYIDVFGRSARGPSANSVDWLRKKIAAGQ